MNGKPLIKDLSDVEFFNRYQCDRFTATVIANKFRYTVQHMCTGLLTTAFSIILRDWYDFAATISGPRELDYAMPAVSNSLVLFLGTMTDAVRNTIEEYGAEKIKAGDVIVGNDPYRVGTHVNDVCFIRPVFHEQKPVGFVTLQAHMLDMGGDVPAGFSGTKKNVYENGLVLSPRLLYEYDQPHLPTWNLVFDNARFGELLMPDMKTIYQNLLLGERLIRETIERYGLDAYLGAIRYATDVSAESMQQAIARLPDGIYEGEDFVDCDGMDDTEEYKIKVAVRVKHGRVEVDFSGTSRQARTSINCGYLDTKTAVATAFKYLIDPETPFTSGSMRDIDIVLPPGTIASAMPPEGTIFLYWESSMPVLLAIFQAFKNALGDNAIGGDTGSLNIHNANGVTEDGVPWVTMAQCGGEHGPWGATKAGDADSYNVFYLANNLDPATESIELDFPVVVLKKEYVADTAGAGFYRGGAAVAKDTLWLSDVQHYSMPLHFKKPSGFGVLGGRDGRTGGVWVWEPEVYDIRTEKNILGTEPDIYRRAIPVAGRLDPETQVPDENGTYFYFARVPIWKTKPFTVFRYLTNGGGGWKDPLLRDPELVCRDVRDEYITVQGAERDYGVVIKGNPATDPESVKVDYEATRRLRESKMKERQ